MVMGKKKLVLCLISIGCVLLIFLTAAWYAFCLKHIHLPDTIRIPSEVLKESFTGKIQEYRGKRYISYYLPQDEAVKKFEKNGFKAVCSGSLANNMNRGNEKNFTPENGFFVLENGAYMTSSTWYLRRKPNRKIFPKYFYQSKITYRKDDLLVVVVIACNDPRKPEFKLLLDEIAAYFNGYIEKQNAILEA